MFRLSRSFGFSFILNKLSSAVPSPGLPAPVLLESFDNAASFTARFGAILSNDPVNKVQGTGSLVIKDAGVVGMAHKSIGVQDMTQAGTVAHYVNVGFDPEYSCMGSYYVGFGINTAFTASLGETFGGALGDQNFLGGGWFCQHASEVPAIAALPKDQPLNMQTPGTVAPFAGARRVDALVKQAQGIPTVVITFDDNLTTQRTNALPIMQAHGLKATCFVPTDVIGSRMSLTQLHELKAAGWDMQADGHPLDTVMVNMADVATAVSELNRGRQALIDNGLNPNPQAFCYPEGRAGTAGLRVTRSTGVSFTAGSAVITMADTTGIVAGMRVASYGAVQTPPTTVLNVDSGTQVTMSSNAIQTGSFGASFTVTSGAFHTGKLQAALRADGRWKIGRLTIQRTVHTRFGFGDMGLLFPGIGHTGATTLADMNTFDVQAILRGTTAMHYLHGVQPGAPAGLSIGSELFNEWCGWLKARQDAGALQVPTVAELIARDGAASFPA